jgi:hypothetical protein
MLVAGGVMIGLAAGQGVGRALVIALPSLPDEGYHGLRFDVDWSVASFLTGVAALSAVVFAMAAGRGHATRRRQLCSIAWVSLSLALLVGTGLLLRGLDRAMRADRGFAADHRLLVNVYDPHGRWNALLDRARALPGIEDATLALAPVGPVSDGCAGTSSLDAPRKVNRNVVEPNYFDVMRIPIVRGAGLTDNPGVLVNEEMARAFWPGGDALGRLLWVGCDTRTRNMLPVAGVVLDLSRPGEPADDPAYYLSRRQETSTRTLALVAHTTGGPYLWSKPLVDAVLAEAPDAHLYEVMSVQDAISVSLCQSRWQAGLLGGVASLAILLAAIGLYGVVACSMAQRTREIGVRMAIGAQPGDVQWMFVGQGLRITVIGVVIGIALSVAVARLLRAYLYGLSPFDPVTFAAASLASILVAMLASRWPARRATKVDPLTALKYE